MSKSFRRYATSDKYRDDRDFRAHRKDSETKSQKKRTSSALKRGDVTPFIEDDGLEDYLADRQAQRESWEDQEIEQSTRKEEYED